MKLAVRWLAAGFASLALMAGASPADAQIRIGQIMGITGPVAGSVAELNAGAKLYIDHINAEGGIAGQKIELVTMDDKFQPNIAAEHAKKLVADPRVVALFLNRGTPHVQAVKPMLVEGKIPLVAPSTGAMVLHQPVNPWIFNVRATYQAEAEHVTRHLGLAGLENVAVFYVADSFGEDAVAGVNKVFKDANKTPTVLEPIDRAKPDYTKAVQKAIAAKSTGVLIIGSSASVSAGVRELRKAGSLATIATLSNNAASTFVKELGDLAPGVIVSQVFPSERKLAVAMIAEAVRLAKARDIKDITPAMIEGFAGAKVLVHALKLAAKDNKTITRASLKKALESFNRVDIGGLEITFNANDHTGLNFSDLAMIGEDGKFRR
jgi:ABC-type branched-subunit amino acid transport system substrate-binding protein